MPHTTSGAPNIWYTTSGDPSGEPVVLVSGMGAQHMVWRDEFVQLLVDQGLFVVRLDNRDVGFSDQTAGPDEKNADYVVRDMALDVFRVFDALGLKSAHISGESLGGAIAQNMALAHPERVRSMVLFYTAPGFQPQYVTDEIVQLLAADAGPQPELTRDELIESLVLRQGMSASRDYPFDEPWARAFVTQSLERSDRMDGVSRQGSAVMQSGDWSQDLDRLAIPTAVIHGRADRLVKVDAGLEIARRIPNSELHVYPDMGHEIARPLWNEYVSIFLRTLSRAKAA